MKCFNIIIAVFSVMLIACEEVPPFIDLNPSVKSKDSSYITTIIPAAQHKAVLIDDITGVRCNNCPKAASRAKDIITSKTEDSVLLLAIYTRHMPNFTLPFDGFMDLTNDFSFQIIDALGVPTGLPSGYVDRHIFTGQSVRFQSYTTWANLVNERLKLATPVNISLEKTITNRELNFIMNLTYTSAPNNNHKFSLYLTEDGLLSKQAMPDGAKEKDDYEHNHVLRHSFGLATGNPINESLVPGRVIIKEYNYSIPTNMDINKCHLMCVVTDVVTNEVVNVRQISLK
ncbi:MAG: Omp28-related outer membrane protein [Bacteroidota bacterium]|nr:Omp28-related outer membrane protein [Bacteroidota bacterium]